MNFIFQLDTQLFLAINHLPHNPLFDIFFGLVTFIGIEGAIWIILAGIIWWQTKKENDSKKILLLTFLVFLLSQAVEIGVKNLIRRPRPQFGPISAFVPFDFAHSYSFPSGHTLIAFSFAYVLSQLRPQKKMIYYLLAVLIAFSRIYLGKHYPSDVLAGALLGILVGIVSWRINPYLWRVFNQKFPRIFV